jgi:cytochrome c-type biogenesis protein CcmH/NrfG
MTPFLLFICASILITLCVISAIYSPVWSVIEAETGRKRPHIHAPGMAGMIMVSTIAFYSYTGAWNTLNILDEAQDKNTQLRLSLPTLAANVQRNPKSLEATEAYAQALGQSGDHAKAADAYRTAILLSGGRPDLILNFATAQILSQDGMVSEEAIKSVEMVLLLVPKEPKARYFKAVYQQQHGQVQEAIAHMQAILKDLPASDAFAATIRERIQSIESSKATK